MYIKYRIKPIFPLFLTLLLLKVPNTHGRFCLHVIAQVTTMKHEVAVNITLYKM